MSNRDWKEAPAWSGVGNGWRPLYGAFRSAGVSFEWHDFDAAGDLDWGRSFHPESVEVCLNLLGTGTIGHEAEEETYSGECAGFYYHGATALRGKRKRGRHQFITVEYSKEFLQEQFGEFSGELHPLIAQAMTRRPSASGVSSPSPLRTEHAELIRNLQRPPVHSRARQIWYRCKAVELATSFFFLPEEGDELFCDRQKRLARERCEEVIAQLRKDLTSPPTLEELGKKVGCSQYHLSRTFSKEMGTTIAQYLRKLRIEKAAELLKSGRFNVTEAALEVGYSSPSHFSQAFYEVYGCCPGLYGIAPDHNRR